MRFHLCAVGQRVPAWVDAGFQEYAGRLRGQHRLELTTVPAADRKNQRGVGAWQTWEAARLRAAAPTGQSTCPNHGASCDGFYGVKHAACPISTG